MSLWEIEFPLLWLLLLCKQDLATPTWYIALTGLIFSIGRIMTKEKTEKEKIDMIWDLVSRMKKDGYNFATNPAVFKWAYEDHPELQITLLIRNNLTGDIIEPQGMPTLQ